MLITLFLEFSPFKIITLDLETEKYSASIFIRLLLALPSLAGVLTLTFISPRSSTMLGFLALGVILTFTFTEK